MKDVAVNSVVQIQVSTTALSTGASITMTATVANVDVYKNNSTTKRASTAGITLTTDFNAITGVHLINIDTSDNTDAGFYAAGNNYSVMLNGVTIDGQTVNAFVGEFSIENGFMRGTDGAVVAGTIGTPVAADISADIANVQSSVNNIGAGGSGGIAFEITSDNVLGALKGVTFAGVQTAGTFADTQINPLNYHNITASAGAIDIVYKTNVGVNRQVTDILLQGYINSNNDTVDVFLYDFVAAAWEVQPSYTLQGVNTTGVNVVEPVIKALTRNTGMGAELGDVYIRFKTTAQPGVDLFVGTLFALSVDATLSSGYGGAITIDTTGGGNPGSDPRVNGTIDNPVDNMADLDLLIASKNFDTVVVRGSSSIALTANSAGLDFHGHAYTVSLNGQSIIGATFNGAFIGGTGTGGGNLPQFNRCRLQTATLPPLMARECGFLPGTVITAGEGGDYTFFEGHNMDSFTNSMTFDFNKVVNTATAVKLNLKPCSGSYTVKNMKATDELSMDGFGQLILDAANTAGGSIRVSPLVTVVDNVVGGFTGTIVKGDVTTSLTALTDLSGATADITAATSGTSFTISNVKDAKGNAITLATDMFAGQLLKAATRPAQSTVSNVIDQVVMIQSVTSGGVVTVKVDDISGAGFSATPNTATTSVRIL